MTGHAYTKNVRNYRYASFRTCKYCGVTQEYSWSPGWPGGYDYFLASGNGPVRIEPECISDVAARRLADAEDAIDRLETDLG